MKSFFIGRNKRDSRTMVDLFTKTEQFSGEITEDVWAVAHVDFVFSCRPDGYDIIEKKEVECVLLTLEEYRELNNKS